jgi:hypothetical protein
VHYFFPVTIYHLTLVWVRSLLIVSGWPIFWRVLILMIWALRLFIVKRQFLIILALPLLLLLIFISIILLLVVRTYWRLFIWSILFFIVEKVKVVRVHERGLPGIVLILVLIVIVLALLTSLFLIVVVVVVIVILWLIHYYIIKYYNGLSSKG